MNINQRAVELLEENKYDESLKLFKEAVRLSRDIQSLTNLAWIYCHEEDDYTKALGLLEEAIQMNPSSHFPYNLLGEVYLRLEKWGNARVILQKAIAINPTKTAYNNLAVADYHLGNKEEAEQYFLLGADYSDWAMYSHVKSLIELGRINEAKSQLNTFSEEADEFVGEVDLADLFVEVGLYEEAVKWFDKGWEIYWKQPNWISRYVYSLIKLNELTRATEILYEAINEKVEEIQEAYKEDCKEDWSESDKQEHIEELLDEKKQYEQLLERISSGYVPIMKFETSIKTECYLFGCKRHNHPKYQGKNNFTVE
ncbi:tetratricopeptide repeat protein [Neobacillus niacini]|uniref:tetratricopeptide repeat protein n=1 Tax=Neobacillus niacini TaxID=86668 RepID=UPI0039834CE5